MVAPSSHAALVMQQVGAAPVPALPANQSPTAAAPVQVQHQCAVACQLRKQKDMIVPDHRLAGCCGAALPPQWHLRAVQVGWMHLIRASAHASAAAKRKGRPPLTVWFELDTNTAKRRQGDGSWCTSWCASFHTFSSQ